MSTFDHIVQKGIQQGIEQGIQQGAEIFRLEAIPKLLNLNKLTIEEIAFITTSPVSYVENLYNKLTSN